MFQFNTSELFYRTGLWRKGPWPSTLTASWEQPIACWWSGADLYLLRWTKVMTAVPVFIHLPTHPHIHTKGRASNEERRGEMVNTDLMTWTGPDCRENTWEEMDNSCCLMVHVSWLKVVRVCLCLCVSETFRSALGLRRSWVWMSLRHLFSPSETNVNGFTC